MTELASRGAALMRVLLGAGMDPDEAERQVVAAAPQLYGSDADVNALAGDILARSTEARSAAVKSRLRSRYPTPLAGRKATSDGENKNGPHGE